MTTNRAAKQSREKRTGGKQERAVLVMEAEVTGGQMDGALTLWHLHPTRQPPLPETPIPDLSSSSNSLPSNLIYRPVVIAV